MLTIASSALSILFLRFTCGRHRPGMEPGKLTNLTAVPILSSGCTEHCARRTAIGYIITLLGGLFSCRPHRPHEGKGVGLTSSIGNSSGHFFFVWTLIAIGDGSSSAILSARGLWSLQWRRPR